MKRLFLCMTLCVLPAFCQDDPILKDPKPSEKTPEFSTMKDLTEHGFFAPVEDTEAVFYPCGDDHKKICADKVPSMRMRIALLEDEIDKLEARIKALEESGHVNRSSLPPCTRFNSKGELEVIERCAGPFTPTLTMPTSSSPYPSR